MPRLPGAEDLGQAPSGRSGRPIATVDTTAIGRGIATLGQGARVLGVGLNERAKKKEEVDQATRFETQRRFLEFSASQDDALQQEGQKAQPGAFGFKEGFQESYKKNAQQFFSTIPEGLKPEYDSKLFQVEDGLAGRALTFEREQRKGYYTNTVNDGLVLIENKLYENPAAFDTNLAEGNAFIDSIPDEDVSPIAKDAMRRDWKKKAQLASLNGLPPKARVEALGEGVETDVAAFGSGREAAKAVVRKKEGFRSSPYWDVNAHRVGYGSDTITKADGSIVKVRPGMTVSREDAERDLDRRVVEFENIAIKKAGRREWGALPPAAQAALISVTYNYGNLPSSVANAVKTGNIGSIASAVEGLAGHNNGINAGRRRSEAALIRGQGGVVGVSGGKVDPRFADIPWNERDRVISGAETEMRQEQAEQRVTAQFAIEDALTNAPIAIQNTGEYLGQMPTQDQFIAAYGDRALQKFKEFEQAIETSRTAFGMQTMPNAEILSLVKDAEPTSSGDNAALQQERYEVLSKAGEATLKAREADPAAYARRVFPAVDQAWKGTSENTMESYGAAVAMSVAAQQQLGITDIKPIPKDAAEYAIELFKNVDKPETERFAAVTSAIMSTPDREQRRAIFEQMVEAGLPEITEGAFEAMARGDQGAARRLMQAAVIDPAKLPGQAPEKPAVINEAIQEELMAEGQIGDIYYGLSDGSAENFVRAERDNKLITNSVNLRMRNGDSLADAIAGVSKDLYGDVQVVSDAGRFNAQVLIPADQDAGVVSEGLAALGPSIRDVMQKAVPVPDDVPTKDGTKAVLEAATSNYIDNVMAEGYFRNSGDGFVFIDPYVGAAVSDSEGTPVVFTMEQILAAKPKRDVRTPDAPLTDDAFDEFQKRFGR